MRKEAVKTAVSRFVELPTLQRSVVILKDVLDESLIEIAALLDLTVDAVKGHLARGRAHLREINAHARPLPDARPASAAAARYVALFNQRDWDGLRALLADDVKLHQSLHPLRVGRADVGLFFTLYAKIDGVSLAPAWLEDREVIAVFEDRADPKPSYIMWLEWRDDRISFIHDYRYVRYVTADAELTLAPEANPADDGAVSDAAARFYWGGMRDNAQAARWRARALQAVTPRKDGRPARVLGAVAEARDGRGEARSVEGWTMSWGHRKLVSRVMRGPRLPRDRGEAALAGALVLSWHGKACLSAPSAIEKASAKASLYA